MPNRAGAAVPFRVAVADDDARVRAALVELLSGDPRIDVCGSFPDGDGLRERCGADHVDLAVIDVAMPGGGPELARAIHATSPDTVIAVYTAHHDRRTRAAMLAAGASAIMVKGATTDVTSAVLDILDDVHRPERSNRSGHRSGHI